MHVNNIAYYRTFCIIFLNTDFVSVLSSLKVTVELYMTATVRMHWA